MMTPEQAVLEMLERGGWMTVPENERETVLLLIGEVITEQVLMPIWREQAGPDA